MIDNSKVVILDSGLWEMKIGFAGDEAPRYKDRSILGYSKNPAVTASSENREIFIGQNAIKKKNLLNLETSLTNDYECRYGNLEKIWHDLFYDKMKIDISEFPIFLTFNSFFDEEKRKILAESLFENFDVPAIYTSISNVTGIYAEGRTTGLVLDSGYSGSFALNIFEGYPIEDNLAICDFGGKIINLELERKVLEKINMNKIKMKVPDYYNTYGYKFDEVFFDDIKFSMFAEDSKDVEITLPDNKKIILESETFENIKKNAYKSLSSLLNEVIDNSDPKYIKELKNHVYLQGGSSLFNDIEKDLFKMINNNNKSMKIYSRTKDEKLYNSWIGASLFATLDTFEQLWVTKEEYEEFGIDAVITRNLI